MLDLFGAKSSSNSELDRKAAKCLKTAQDSQWRLSPRALKPHRRSAGV